MKTIPITVRVPEDMRLKLELYATVSGQSQREIVTRAILWELGRMFAAGGSAMDEAIEAVEKCRNATPTPPPQEED